MISWAVWARGLGGVTPSERLVLIELARLADATGVAICSIAHLAGVTGRARSSIFRALASLEKRGVVSREMRYADGHQAASRYVLRAVSEKEETVAVKPDFGVDSALPACDGGSVSKIALSDNEGLRVMLRRAVGEGWKGEAATCLACTLVESGARQFSAAISHCMEFQGLSYAQARADVCSVAWEVLAKQAREIALAVRPWAFWTTIVNRRCVDATGDTHVERAVEPGLIPEAGLRPGEGEEGSVWVSVDDFNGPLELMVRALIKAGLEESLAWAGTLRIAELAAEGGTRRHTLAGADPRLADLGVSPKAARAWMTMLVGSRRGAKASILEQGASELGRRAREVVDALKTAA